MNLDVYVIDSMLFVVDFSKFVDIYEQIEPGQINNYWFDKIDLDINTIDFTICVVDFKKSVDIHYIGVVYISVGLNLFLDLIWL